jgi:hypothetical protein
MAPDSTKKLFAKRNRAGSQPFDHAFDLIEETLFNFFPVPKSSLFSSSSCEPSHHDVSGPIHVNVAYSHLINSEIPKDFGAPQYRYRSKRGIKRVLVYLLFHVFVKALRAICERIFTHYLLVLSLS